MALLNSPQELEEKENERMAKLKRKMINQDCIKFSVNLPRHIHTKLRILAAKTDKDIKDLIMEGIEKILK